MMDYGRDALQRPKRFDMPKEGIVTSRRSLRAGLIMTGAS
jgi:hypothetical protein